MSSIAIVGEVVRIEAQFTGLLDVAGNVIAATGVRLEYLSPGATEPVPVAMLPGTGANSFIADIPTSGRPAGTYKVKVTCDGPSPVVLQDTFVVAKPIF